MATAHPKRDIDPRTPLHQLPGDLLLSTARRLGELGVDAAFADAIRRPASEAQVRRQLAALRGELGVNVVMTEAAHARSKRPRLIHSRYTPIAQQVKNLWRWNKRYGWGLPQGWDEKLDVPAELLASWDAPESALVSVNVVAFLEAKGGVLGEHRTFEAYWEIIKTQHPNHDRNPGLLADPDHLRLLPGITHIPGVRIEVIDHGANWNKETGLQPVDVRSPDTSPHAGLLASLAHHPKRIRKMDGTTVPFEWIAGYQCSVPGYGPLRHVPLVRWNRDDRQVHLNAYWDVSPRSTCSVPVRLGGGPRP